MLIITAVLIGIFLFLSFMMNGKISDTINKTDQIKKQIENEESFSFMQKNIEDNQANENEIAKYIIPPNSVADFIKLLKSIVATSSLKSQVGSITAESSANLSSIDAELLNVNITVEGTWSNIYFFLKLLETYPLKIDIENVSLKQFADYTVKGKQVPQWSADVEFTVVKFKDK